MDNNCRNLETKLFVTHCRDRHAPALATHYIALSIEALDHEQLRIDRVYKSLREIAHLFDPARLPSFRM